MIVGYSLRSQCELYLLWVMYFGEYCFYDQIEINEIWKDECIIMSMSLRVHHKGDEFLVWDDEVVIDDEILNDEPQDEPHKDELMQETNS